MERIFRFQEVTEQKFHIFIAQEDMCSLHGHDFLEFSYVSQGVLEHVLDGVSSTVRAGDYFIVDYGTVHSYRRISPEPLRVVNLLFYPDFMDQILSGRRSFEDAVNSYLIRFNSRTLRSSPTGRVFHDEDGKVAQLVEEAVAEYRDRQDGYIAYIRCLLIKLLILTMRKIGRVEEPEASDPVRRAAEHLRQHYRDPMTVSQLAQEQGYSPAWLSRKFSAEMGMGFSEYLQRVRIGQCCRLLARTELPVPEIAALVGYEDQKYFNRLFRKLLNMSPREYRRSQSAEKRNT